MVNDDGSETTPSPLAGVADKSNTVCLYCRQRKVRCDRQLPRCGFCIRSDVDCNYAKDNKTPGSRAGYVARLERRLEQLESRVQVLEQKDTSNDHMLTTPVTSSSSFVPDGVHGLIPAFEAEFRQTQEQAERMSGQTVNTGSISLSGDPLSPLVVTELCGVWFEKYHPWFPILHQPSFWESMQALDGIDTPHNSIVMKSIAAVTMRHSQTMSAGYDEKREIIESLRNKVIVDALGSLTLQSLQALLILTNLDYGVGNFHSFWNLVALCKRICLHLGLRDLVVSQGGSGSKASSIPPRILPLPSSIIEKEERVRAYWMSEMLDNVSTLGGGWNTAVTPPEPTAALPCSDSIWVFPEHIINIWSIGEYNFSSAFSLCIILSTSELWHVHRFLQRSFDLRTSQGWFQFQAESQQIDERLTTWRGLFVAAVYRLINAEHAQEERAEMDPNIVLTNCILDCAVIVLFQRLAPAPHGIENVCEPWTYATNRCTYACDDLSAKVRLVHDSELEVCNPHLVFTLFVAARFYLIYAKAVNADLPGNLHVLVNALHICGKRWDLARRYETIVKTAAAEHRLPVLTSSLPRQFYDPQFSTIDIDETLKVAIEIAERR